MGQVPRLQGGWQRTVHLQVISRDGSNPLVMTQNLESLLLLLESRILQANMSPCLKFFLPRIPNRRMTGRLILKQKNKTAAPPAKRQFPPSCSCQFAESYTRSHQQARSKSPPWKERGLQLISGKELAATGPLVRKDSRPATRQS